MIPEVKDNMVVGGDIEAIGFLDVVYKLEHVHCLCCQDVETEELFLFHDNPEFNNVDVYDPYDGKVYSIPERTGTKLEGLKFWSQIAKKGGKLAVHNAHTYDREVVNRVFPDNDIPLAAWDDTFIRSKLQWFDRSTPKGCKGPHGLQAWGARQGINKPEVTDWKEMDAFKLHRVIEDVKIQTGTYHLLNREASMLAEKGIKFDSAISNIEVPYVVSSLEQELRGAKVDVPHVNKTIAHIDKRLEELTGEIEPNLPPTVKPKGSKVSKTELAELLGVDPKRTKDEYEKRKKDGEVTLVVVKPFVKPSVNFTRTQKTAVWFASNVVHGFTPKFTKKTEVTEWIKKKDSTCKKPTVEWEYEKVIEETLLLNKNTCDYWDCNPTQTDFIAGPYTRVEFLPSTMTQNDVVKSYLIRLGLKHVEEWNLAKDVYGQKIKCEEDTVVRWPKKAAPENQLVKVCKKGEFLVSSPKLTEEDYEQLPEGLGKKIAEYNTLAHRRRFLSNPKDPENKGILSMVREDGRMPCGINVFNTATGRSSHRGWANAPSAKALLGEAIRRCIIAEEGNKLVGADQKSSQLSIAAFFAKNKEYYDSVASGSEYKEDEQGNKVLDEVTGKPIYLGTSAHCFSARNFGIVSQEEYKRALELQFEDEPLLHSIGLRRGFSKGASFGVVFGCSGAKLAGMLKVPEKEGNEKKNNFLRQMGLDNVKAWLDTCKHRYSRGKGYYIPLPFGYWVYCSQDHKAINYLIQGTEAIMEKLAELYIDKEIKKLDMQDKAGRIISYHDECLYECPESFAEDLGRLCTAAFTWAGQKLFEYYDRNKERFPNVGGPAFAIDLAGGYDVGDNYWECH